MATRSPRYSDIYALRSGIGKTKPNLGKLRSSNPLTIARNLPKTSITAAQLADPVGTGTPSTGRTVGSGRSQTQAPPLSQAILNPSFQRPQRENISFGQPNKVGIAIESWLSPSKGYNFRDIGDLFSTGDSGIFKRVMSFFS
jgi:hypothetical protein